MYQKKTVIIVAISMLFAGILLGAGIGFYVSIKASETIAMSAELIHGERTSFWSNRSYNAYLNEPPIVGIWGLEGMAEEFSKLLNDTIEYQLFFDKQTLYKDLLITHARLVKLYNKVGNKDKVSYHEKKALHYAELGYPSGELNDMNNILEFVEKIDIANKKHEEGKI